ncbi:hypothetical protein ACQP1O_17785 [Nocardia sp. CA-151230]|uniref:hypothetical protein n=1 Tax=Nocardia sp. CA-151230 TaxID=3239982 RepID=UPI003D8F6E2F
MPDETCTPERLRACEIEIVDRVLPGTDPAKGPGVIVPTEVRINGVPVLARGGRRVTVQGIALYSGDCVSVTLTLFA